MKVTNILMLKYWQQQWCYKHPDARKYKNINISTLMAPGDRIWDHRGNTMKTSVQTTQPLRLSK